MISAPPQIRTGPNFKPTKQWTRTFAGPLPPNPVSDDYDINKKIAREELKYHHSKLQDVPFYNVSAYGRKKLNQVAYCGTINSVRAILEENPPIPPRKATSQAKLPSIVHDKPFNPTGLNTSNKRTYDLLGKFPDYVPDPPPVGAKRKEKDPDAPPAFRLTHRYKSRPTPTVALNVRNLRSAGMLLRR